jgi:hypothetical protein
MHLGQRGQPTTRSVLGLLERTRYIWSGIPAHAKFCFMDMPTDALRRHRADISAHPMTSRA